MKRRKPIRKPARRRVRAADDDDYVVTLGSMGDLNEEASK